MSRCLNTSITIDSLFVLVFIISLDKILNGGLIPGNIIDVCGFSASGKTQFHTTIAIHWAINHGYETFVIDTKGDFSGDRINRMLLSQNKCDADNRKRIMRCIKVEKCDNVTDLINLIKNLIEMKLSFPNFKLLVIDSLPSLWFHFHGTKNSHGYQKLAILADLMRKLAVEYGIVVITVNIETRTIITAGKKNSLYITFYDKKWQCDLVFFFNVCLSKTFYSN